MSLISAFRKKYIDKKILFTAIALAGFCSLYGLFVYQDYYSYVYKFDTSSPRNYLFQLLNTAIEFFIFIAYCYCFLSSKIWVKIPLLVILLLCFSTELGYVEFYGSFSHPNDITIALTATGEQVNGKILEFLNVKILLIPVAFFAAQYTLRDKSKKSGVVLMTAVFLLLIVHAAASYFIYLHLAKTRGGLRAININENLFLPLPVGVNTSINSIFAYFFLKNDGFKSKRDQLIYKSNIYPHNNIVVIVEETLRGDHLNINGYNRQTSGFLQELQKKKLLTNFGICAAGSTSSLTSGNLLLTGLKPENPDRASKTFTYPSLFQYAKASNYKTHFFDGQMNDKWAGTLDDYSYVDNFVSRNSLLLSESFKYEVDFHIAKAVNRILKTSTGNFIYVIKRGFHFPYSRNYPKNKKVWKPVMEDESHDKPTPATLINSYDNALHYNLDSFFKILVENREQSLAHSVIIYTGDHGESFLEDGKSTQHTKSARYEALTGLVIIGKNLHLDTAYKASHHNILPTVLDLMNYPVEKTKYPYSLSLLRAKEKDNVKRHYVLPDLNSPKVYAFDK